MKQLNLKKWNEPIYLNRSVDKKRLKLIIQWAFTTFGSKKTVDYIELLKETGYQYATKAGISLGIDDLTVPSGKAKLVRSTQSHLIRSNQNIDKGFITYFEYTNQALDEWNRASELIKGQVVETFSTEDILNPVYMMAFSGARGNISQVRQLSGMRGLMTDPTGQVMNYAIRSNFREGITLTEYLISCYGARKGVVDTALRTATSGYLTRRLVDVAHHVLIRRYDCGTTSGFLLSDLEVDNKTVLPLKDRLVGRVAADSIQDPSDATKTLVSRNQDISHALANKLSQVTKAVFVRSSMTCNDGRFVCQLCYGWNFSSNRVVNVGETVGIIAAQSIGEPGTQLTMRTFHTGGVFSGEVSDALYTPCEGIVDFPDPIPGKCVRTSQGKVAFLTKQVGLFVVKAVQGPDYTFVFEPLSLIFVKQGQFVFQGQAIGQTSEMCNQILSNVTRLKTFYSPVSGQLRLQQAQYFQTFLNPVMLLNEDRNKKRNKKKVQPRKNELAFKDSVFSNFITTGNFLFYAHRQRLAQHDTNISVQEGDLIQMGTAVYFYKKESQKIIGYQEQKEHAFLNPSFRKKQIKTIKFPFKASKFYQNNSHSLAYLNSLQKFQSEGGEIIQQHSFFNWSKKIKQTQWIKQKIKHIASPIENEQPKKPSKKQPKKPLKKQPKKSLKKQPKKQGKKTVKKQSKKQLKKVKKSNLLKKRANKLPFSSLSLFKSWNSRSTFNQGFDLQDISVSKTKFFQFLVTLDYSSQSILNPFDFPQKIKQIQNCFVSLKSQKSISLKPFRFRKQNLIDMIYKSGYFTTYLYGFNTLGSLKPMHFRPFKKCIGDQTFLVWNKHTLLNISNFKTCFLKKPSINPGVTHIPFNQIGFLSQQHQRLLNIYYQKLSRFSLNIWNKEPYFNINRILKQSLKEIWYSLIDHPLFFSTRHMYTHFKKIRHDHQTRLYHFQTKNLFLQQTKQNTKIQRFKTTTLTNLQLNAICPGIQTSMIYRWRTPVKPQICVDMPVNQLPLKLLDQKISKSNKVTNRKKASMNKRKRKRKTRRKRLVIPQSWLWQYLSKRFLHAQFKTNGYSAYSLLCLGLILDQSLIHLNNWVTYVKKTKRVQQKMGSVFFKPQPSLVFTHQKTKLFYFLQQKKQSKIQSQSPMPHIVNEPTVFNPQSIEPSSEIAKQNQTNPFYTNHQQNCFTNQKMICFNRLQKSHFENKIATLCQDYGYFTTRLFETPCLQQQSMQYFLQKSKSLLISEKLKIRNEVRKRKYTRFFKILDLKPMVFLLKKDWFKKGFLNPIHPNQKGFEKLSFQLHQIRMSKRLKKVFPLNQNGFFLSAHSVFWEKKDSFNQPVLFNWVRTQFQDLKPVKQKEKSVKQKAKLVKQKTTNLKNSYPGLIWSQPAQSVQTSLLYGWVCFINQLDFQSHRRYTLEGNRSIFNNYQTISRYFSCQKQTVSYQSSQMDIWLQFFKTSLLYKILTVDSHMISFYQQIPSFIPLLIHMREPLGFFDFENLYKPCLTFYAEQLSLKRGSSKKPNNLFAVINFYYRLNFLKQAQLPEIFSEHLFKNKQTRWLCVHTGLIQWNSLTRYKPILRLNGIFLKGKFKSKKKKSSSRKRSAKRISSKTKQNLQFVFLQKNMISVFQKAKQILIKDLNLTHRLQIQNDSTKQGLPNLENWQTKQEDYKTREHVFKRKQLVKIKYTIYQTIWKSKQLNTLKPVLREPKELKDRKTPYTWFERMERQLNHYFQASFWNRFRYNQLCLLLYEKKRQWLTLQPNKHLKWINVSSTVQRHLSPFFNNSAIWEQWIILKSFLSSSTEKQKPLRSKRKFLKSITKTGAFLRSSKLLVKPHLRLKSHKKSGKNRMTTPQPKRQRKRQTKGLVQKYPSLPIFAQFSDLSISRQRWRLIDQHFLHRPNALVVLEAAQTTVQPRMENNVCEPLFKKNEKTNLHAVQSQYYGECLGFNLMDDDRIQNGSMDVNWTTREGMVLNGFSPILGRKVGFTYSQSIREYHVRSMLDIYYLTPEDIRTYLFETSDVTKFTFHDPKMTFFTCLGTMFQLHFKLSPEQCIRDPGQIIAITKSTMVIRRVKQLTLTKHSTSILEQNTFITRDTPLSTIQMQETVADDIIQGIPKIEKLFEARAVRPGITLTSLLQEKFLKLANLYMHKVPNYRQVATEEARNFIQYYTLNAIQSVYQSQNVTIADKHLEVIIKQMTAKVMITEPQNSGLLRGDVVTLHHVQSLNLHLSDSEQIHYEPVVLGITKSSLQTFGFISAAGFQETVNVLTQAAFFRKSDFLFGLKENVMLGHLIPAGTGLLFH